MTAIPASAIVNVIPAVLAAGGSALDLNGLLLTQGLRAPIGTVLSFASETDVAAYFGAGSVEDLAATKYFLGYNNSEKKPGALLIAQYPAGNVAAYLRGGRISTLTLAQLQAITGSLSVTIDGVVKTIAAVNIAAATSFSNAAALLTTQLAAAGVVISYDAIAGAFVVTSSTSGASSTIGFGSGTASTALGLTQAAGAVTSQGAVAGVPSTNMNAIIAATQNWAGFATTWEPSTSDCVLFAEWTNSKGNRYFYAMADTDGAAKVVPDTTSAAALCRVENLSGIIPIYEPVVAYTAAAVLGFVASLDFDKTNGRATLAFLAQSGMAAGVTNQTDAANLITNGYNLIGAYATANDTFTFFYPGSILGQFLWADSYVNQIWMNSGFQDALMTLETTAGSIPYNATGYAQIEDACADQIRAALNYGAIRAGVTLSSQQVAEVNADAGLRISDTIQQRGWYLQVQDTSPSARVARTSPPCTFWYTDGQSVQQITLASVQIQ